MTTIDKIRTEIDAFYTKYKAKFHQNGDSYHLGIIDGLDMAERILDTLEEPVSDCHDLEGAAETHVKNKYCLTKLLGTEIQEAVNDFIAGAEWQKAKMMEGTVIELGETYKDLSLSVNAKELNQVLQPLGVGDGDKVKIIIVKEEEK